MIGGMGTWGRQQDGSDWGSWGHGDVNKVDWGGWGHGGVHGDRGDWKGWGYGYVNGDRGSTGTGGQRGHGGHLMGDKVTPGDVWDTKDIGGGGAE